MVVYEDMENPSLYYSLTGENDVRKRMTISGSGLVTSIAGAAEYI